MMKLLEKLLRPLRRNDRPRGECCGCGTRVTCLRTNCADHSVQDGFSCVRRRLTVDSAGRCLDYCARPIPLRGGAK